MLNHCNGSYSRALSPNCCWCFDVGAGWGVSKGCFPPLQLPWSERSDQALGLCRPAAVGRVLLWTGEGSVEEETWPLISPLWKLLLPPHYSTAASVFYKLDVGENISLLEFLEP